MNLEPKHIAEIAVDLFIVCIAFYFGHWFGFALCVVFIASYYAVRVLLVLQTIQNVLLSRMPDRCARCHREIVDEGGIIDTDIDGEIRVYHEACSEKLDKFKERWNQDRVNAK